MAPELGVLTANFYAFRVFPQLRTWCLATRANCRHFKHTEHRSYLVRSSLGSRWP